MCYLAGQQELQPCSGLLLTPTLSPPLLGVNIFFWGNIFFGDQEEKGQLYGTCEGGGELTGVGGTILRLVRGRFSALNFLCGVITVALAHHSLTASASTRAGVSRYSGS